MAVGRLCAVCWSVSPGLTVWVRPVWLVSSSSRWPRGTAATRWVLVPLQMSGFALRGLKELLRVTNLAAERLNPQLEVLGVVPTFVNMRTRLSRDMLPALCDISGVSVLPVYVSYMVWLQESSLVGVPINDLAPTGLAAEAYRRLVIEVLAAVDAASADGRARA